ncbi:MAG TPA: SCO family protein [Candidatus Eisenbacteria bacterium]|nr:SCO family protein [Candidatus Eisenbacteria bacterium]
MKLLVGLALLLVAPWAAHAGEERPAALRDVAFAQRLGDRVPVDAPLRDETGRAVTLREYLGKPLLLVPAYYTCPMLCTLVQNGVVSALRALPFDIGKEFTVVTFSFDPTDGPEAAAKKKEAYLAEYRRPGAEAGWHFLTGGEASIKALTDAIGFRATYDEAHHQYAHASGIVLLTPEGRITRYFFGVEYAPRDLRLAMVEASANKIGTVVDQLLLFCFHYDPATGRYSRLALDAVRAGGVVTIVALGAAIGWWLRRERLRGAAA